MTAIPVSYAGENFPSLSALARHLARRFGRRESTVLTYLSRYGGNVEHVVQIISIERKRPIPWSPQQVEQLRRLWADGESASAADASACRDMRCSARCAGSAFLVASECNPCPGPSWARRGLAPLSQSSRR